MMNKRSDGLGNRFLTKALIKSCGIIDEEMERPLIAVINSWNELHPGHIHLRGIAEAVKAGVRMAGGTPFESCTIALCDGIRTMESMKYVLPSREIIADSIELVAETFCADGMVLISSCDKIEPANLMAAARVNIPTVIVTGGAMVAGTYHGRKINGVDMDVARSGYRDGKKETESDLNDLVECLCETPGSCFGMGTANTMACLVETLGMSIPYSACTLAVDSNKLRLAKKSGMAVVELIKRDTKPSDIMTKSSLINALKVNEAIGGSTNTFLHLPALAHELGLELKMEEFDKASMETPHLCNIIPTGPFDMRDLRDAGGMPGVLKEMESMLDLNTLTVTGKTLGENIRDAKIYNRDVIRSVSNPVHSCGAHMVLKGNLAPDGCVIKEIACPESMKSHRGPARVFENAEVAMEALRLGEIRENDVMVIRYEGPKGGPGMREMVDLTGRLSTMNLENSVAIVTDGRFSGYSRGAVFGHVSPEAQEGGPIAIIRDGDIIAYDVMTRTLNVELTDEEISERLETWQPKEIKYKGYLKRYSKNVSSANKGAIFI